MKKFSLAALIALSTIGSVSALQANEVEVSGNVGATSNYIWRGMTQTDDKASINGGIDLGYKGFYLGSWASNVDFLDDANYELDVYAGYGNSIADISYDISYIKFLYPGSDGSSDFDEATISLGYDINDLSLGLSYALATYTENDGVKNDYAEATASYDFKVASLDLSYGDYQNTGNNYSIGVSKSFDLKGNTLDLSVAYSDFDSDASKSDDQENVFATIAYSF
jgi:uncharacterized protein (TIGR02001 family)